MIELTEEYRRENNGQNSKGNQLKFVKDGVWYKADGLGCEGLSETIASNILDCSDCVSYVRYNEEQVLYKGTFYNACKSDSFVDESCETVVTSTRLIENYFGRDVYDLMRLKTPRQKIKKFVDLTAKATKLAEEEIGRNLTMMLELDAYILNNDRHFNNISFIYNEKTDTFRIAPIYDNGAAFMAYKEYYRNERYTEIIEARPFSRDFNRQKEAAEALFGRQLHIYLDNFSKVMPDMSIYDPQTRLAVMDIIKTQTGRYQDIVEIDNEEKLELSFRELKKTLYRQLIGVGLEEWPTPAYKPEINNESLSTRKIRVI